MNSKVQKIAIIFFLLAMIGMFVVSLFPNK